MPFDLKAKFICTFKGIESYCSVVSQLFSVARHAGCFKLGSKPTTFFYQTDIIPLRYLVTCILLGDQINK